MKSLRLLSLLAAPLLLLACGGPAPSTDGGTGGGGSTDGGYFLDFVPPPGTPAGNSVLLTVSGEAAMQEGFGFPPASAGGEAYFVDGWELRFEQVLVTVGAVTLSENPDLNPNDPSQTGAVVARAQGPWAVDLAKAGPLAAKELNGRAFALARLTAQTERAGTPAFDPTAKYAFGYSLLTAGPGAFNVNLDAEGQAAYRAMAEQGHSVWVQGTATWRGAQGTPACRSTDAAYDFGRYPKVVTFAFGFKAPVDFQNCQNPELSPADARGLQTQTNAETVAQLTLHFDHPFWESLEEDAPLRFDALAALGSADAGAGPGTFALTEAQLGLDFQAFRDAQGAAIPWRTCGPVLANERSAGTVAYDPVNVPVNPLGGAAGLATLHDYMTYNLSTFGHFNNDGLCFPARRYPSPQ